MRGELLRDPAGREHIFRAGEAMGEQRVRRGRIVGRIQAGGKLLPVGARECNGLALHSARIRFSIAPTLSISHFTLSPGRRNLGGFMKKATPAGDPVTMMSPGKSVMPRLQ